MGMIVRSLSPLVIVVVLPVGALAHTDKVSGQDYSGFERNDGRGSCCNWLDCGPASAPVMEPDGEKIIDRGRNKYRFEQDKVVRRPSDDGNWHVCGNGSTLFCIIAPAQSRRETDTDQAFFTPFLRAIGWQAAADPRWSHADESDATGPICRAPRM